MTCYTLVNSPSFLNEVDTIWSFWQKVFMHVVICEFLLSFWVISEQLLASASLQLSALLTLMQRQRVKAVRQWLILTYWNVVRLGGAALIRTFLFIILFVVRNNIINNSLSRNQKRGDNLIFNNWKSWDQVAHLVTRPSVRELRGSLSVWFLRLLLLLLLLLLQGVVVFSFLIRQGVTSIIWLVLPCFWLWRNHLWNLGGFG